MELVGILVAVWIAMELQSYKDSGKDPGSSSID